MLPNPPASLHHEQQVCSADRDVDVDESYFRVKRHSSQGPVLVLCPQVQLGDSGEDWYVDGECISGWLLKPLGTVQVVDLTVFQTHANGVGHLF